MRKYCTCLALLVVSGASVACTPGKSPAAERMTATIEVLVDARADRVDTVIQSVESDRP